MKSNVNSAAFERLRQVAATQATPSPTAHQRPDEEAPAPPPEIRVMPYPGSDAKAAPPEDLDTRLYREGYKTDDRAGQVWGPKAEIRTQYLDPRFLGTWQEGPAITRQLNLSTAEEAALYNDLHARSEPPGCPELVFEHPARIEFHAGAYVALVCYREVRYRRLVELNKSKPAPTNE